MTDNVMLEQTDRLGPQERRFLTGLAGAGKRVFKLQDALPYWPSRHQTRKALSRLESKGWLLRLERAIYLIVPLEAGQERTWTEDPFVIAIQLDPGAAVAYWSALRFWGMTEQLPRTTFVQTARRRFSPRVEILGVHYRFVVVTPRKIFGVVTQTSEGLPFRVTDREKTIIDACDRPDLCGGVQQLVAALRSSPQLDWEKVDDYLSRFKSGAVYKRLGFLIERLDLPIRERDERLRQWRLSLTEGVAMLDPGGSHEGPVDTHWRIRVNVRALRRTR
jgi:predicted transcriptional regulator of viral defense system